jgi:hypothetical protein
MASQTAADKVNEARSARASVLAELRRLYAALRRAVAAGDAAAIADLEVLCDISAAGIESSDQAETQTQVPRT